MLAKPEMTKCANCGSLFETSKATSHTIKCYRNSISCKVCGEKLLRSMKAKHLAYWRSEDLLLDCIANDDEEELNLAFDHGADPEHHIKGQTLLHLCALRNSLECLLALISRGVEVDPTDNKGCTPLLVALEKGNTKVVKTLVELGADIEKK
eukprot:TRINITY_DN723_c0_g3_i1.p1 TRINITY_DN723_c0_g3~~TRINITY_DN723_c0_g3_i1.p1  ORF type:complete len:152 (-),score=34.49 TRINITY_DN723_c0_g3_i1:318-773(-)